MLFVAITGRRIAHNLRSFNTEEFKVHSSTVTVVTDGFLSKILSEPDGFAVIESPLICQQNFRDIIYSKVTYRKEDDTFEVFKSTISGRPIYYHLSSNQVRLPHSARVLIFACKPISPRDTLKII